MSRESVSFENDNRIGSREINVCLIRTSSAPSFRTYSSFFPEVETMTLAPRSLAIWIAKEPTAVLPPFIKMVCPSSSFTSSRAWRAVKPASEMPAASIGVMLEGRLTMWDSGIRMNSERVPCLVVCWRPTDEYEGRAQLMSNVISMHGRTRDKPIGQMKP